MQAIMETIFDIAYLLIVLTLGVFIALKAKGRAQYLLFGAAAILLGAGDAFHLIPRIIALNGVGVENYAAPLGIGKLVTSITMTVFYAALFVFLTLRYEVKNKNALLGVVAGLSIIRIILCVFPQNQWTSADAPLSWGIYRNIPFVFLGALIAVLFFIYAKKNSDKHFRFMWLAITLSFAFYIPVVLFADALPLIGMLMIPKTVCYVWAVVMGLSALNKSTENIVKDEK